MLVMNPKFHFFNIFLFVQQKLNIKDSERDSLGYYNKKQVNKTDNNGITINHDLIANIRALKHEDKNAIVSNNLTINILTLNKLKEERLILEKKVRDSQTIEEISDADIALTTFHRTLQILNINI